MATLDLPAHNVYDEVSGADPFLTIVGGPEALASTDTSSYVDFILTSAFFVGGSIAIGAPAAGVGGGSVLGYGVWVPSPGQTFVSADFVALGYRTVEHAVPSASTSFYEPVPTSSPALTCFYTGHSKHECLFDFPLGSGPADAREVIVPVERSDWVPTPGPTGGGSGGTGLNGICPEWTSDAVDTRLDGVIRVYYMAIRVTYNEAVGAADPVRRRFY